VRAAPQSPEKEAPVERRLAAILAADVVGYSRLMGIDEVGTLRRLRAYRGELIDPAIAARRGRIVKTTGDGLLVEFPSAVDAVACAITAQRAIAGRNAGEPEDRRLVFRINVGDIIIEANDIFGDGVNVAARLETLSQPGGLCISRAVRDQVRDKLPVTFDDLGEQEVKNIARPVRAFALGPDAIAAAPGGARALQGCGFSKRHHSLTSAVKIQRKFYLVVARCYPALHFTRGFLCGQTRQDHPPAFRRPDAARRHRLAGGELSRRARKARL
jgi:class 3 adenylate cyclase